jgi:hypothetical protein
MRVWRKGFIKAAGVGAWFALVLAIITTFGIWYFNRAAQPKLWDENRLNVTRDNFWMIPKENRVQINYILENRSDATFLVSTAAEVEYEGRYKGQNASEVLPKDAMEINYPISIPAHSRRELTITLTRNFADMNPPENGSHEAIQEFSQRVMRRVQDDMPNVEAFQLRVPLQHVVINLPLY